MPLDRNPVPRNKEPLNAYLERTLQTLDDWASRIETRVNELIRLRFVDGLEVRYRWDDTSTDISVPAAAGEVKCNSVLPQNATQFAVSRLDDFGRLALSASLDFIDVPGFFELNDLTRDHFYEYTMSNTVQRETDLTFDVVFVEQGTGAPPIDGDLVQAQFWPGLLIVDSKQI